MKDFSPHVILRHPSTSDEEVEHLINLTSSRRGGPVILLIEPPFSPTPRGEHSLPARWPVSERPEKPTARESSKPKAEK